jgi:hypothetical protein
MISLKHLLIEGNGPLTGGYLDKGVALSRQLIQRGFSKTQAAAIVGNMWAESTFDTTAKNDIGAIGLLQWIGSRKDELFKFAKSKKKVWSDLNLQLDFIKYELLDEYDGKYAYESTMFTRAMQYGDTIQDKAEGFAKVSERPRKSELDISLSTRQIAAKNVYDALTGKKQVAPKITNTGNLIGKMVYPTKANGYVNVRDEDYVNNGMIDNLIAKITYPQPAGYIKQVVTGDSNIITQNLGTGANHYSEINVVGSTNTITHTSTNAGASTVNVTATGDTNTIGVTQSGTTAKTVTINSTGNSNNISVNQSN